MSVDMNALFNNSGLPSVVRVPQETAPPQPPLQRDTYKDSRLSRLSVSSSIRRGMSALNNGLDSITKAAQTVAWDMYENTKRVISYQRPPPVEQYDMNSDLFGEEIVKSKATHRTFIATFESAKKSNEDELNDLAEQSAELAMNIEKERRTGDELMKAVIVHTRNAKKFTEQKTIVDVRAQQKIAEWSEEETKFLISKDIVEGRIRVYCTATCEQVQDMEGLKDPAKWKAMTKENVTEKFNKLENMSWPESPHCPDGANFQHYRMRLPGGGVEDAESFKERLMTIVGYTPPKVVEVNVADPSHSVQLAPAPAPVPNPFSATTLSEMTDEDFFAEYERRRKRKAEAMMPPIEEGNESENQDQADGDNNENNGEPDSKRARTSESY